jgi:hypothetical protein
MICYRCAMGYGEQQLSRNFGSTPLAGRRSPDISKMESSQVQACIPNPNSQFDTITLFQISRNYDRYTPIISQRVLNN